MTDEERIKAVVDFSRVMAHYRCQTCGTEFIIPIDTPPEAQMAAIQAAANHCTKKKG